MKPQRRSVSPERVDALVQARIGLDASRRLRADRERLIDLAMTRAGVHDENAYVALLQRDQHAFDDLISDLTVPESYFFRDPPHFELLRRQVLPALVAARRPAHALELWSAGCAGGEEAYSLAILLEQEQLAQRGHVLATDVSRKALARASAGLYTRWALRATSEDDIARYFEVSGKAYRLVSRLRERVHFRKHSLSALPYPRPRTAEAGFDLVLCRNVMIYFDAPTIALAGQQLAQSLAADGWLMLGPSDPLLKVEEWCDVVPTPFGMLYRRRPAEPEKPRVGAWQEHGHGHGHGRGSASRSTPPHPSSEGPVPRSQPPRTEAHGTPSRGPARAPSQEAAIRPDRSARPEAVELELLRALARSHGLSAAEAGCRDELTRQPLSAALHLLHAELLVDLGNDHQAELALRRALYLDGTLLSARMLSATLAERRGEHALAESLYAQLSAQCRAQPADQLVPLADGLTFGSLSELANRRIAALRELPARKERSP